MREKGSSKIGFGEASSRELRGREIKREEGRKRERKGDKARGREIKWEEGRE